MTSAWYKWLDAKRGVVVLDGGLGSELIVRGNDLSKSSVWAGSLLVDNPEEVRNEL